VTPLQFTDEKIQDPKIRAQLQKVVVVADPEIEVKFDALAGPVLPGGSLQRVKEAVWVLDELGSISELMDLLRAEK
jgi:hypothetical protein